MLDPLRRRSPEWVRAMTSREIHAIAFRFNYERKEADLSEQQEWLYDALISELEWRRSHARWPEGRCSCELCFGPFPD